MKIPKKLKIGGHHVTVRQVEQMQGDFPTHWRLDESQNLIELQKSNTMLTEKEVTLMHRNTPRCEL